MSDTQQMTASETTNQMTLTEFVGEDADTQRAQCQAFADSTGERCQRVAMPLFPYCGDHIHLFDAETDLHETG